MKSIWNWLFGKPNYKLGSWQDIATEWLARIIAALIILFAWRQNYEYDQWMQRANKTSAK